MNLEKYFSEYKNVSREELKKIKDSVSSELLFESKVRSLHEDREKEKRNGRPALRPQPLVHVLSVSVQPKNENQHKPLAVYGRIHAEFGDSRGMIVHELYKREPNVAEILGTNNILTLNGPCYSCLPQHACIPLFRSRINVLLFEGAYNVFAEKCFYLDDTETEDGYEQVKSKSIPCEQGSLTVQYIAIPFGVNCRIEVMISNRKGSEKRNFINVNGKIAVRYANSYGNYFSEECVLFEKQANDFERVEIDRGKSLHLSRCWVALPAYSSIVVGVDLSDFETTRNIVNDTVKFVAQQGMGSSDSFVLDDFIIRVHVTWFSPEPLGRCAEAEYQCSPSMLGISTREMLETDTDRGVPAEEEMDTEGGIHTEEMDTEGEDESFDGALLSNLNHPWSLGHHRSKPWSSPAVEIFSVVVGREKSKAAVQIYGSVEVLSDDNEICCIFKRHEKDDALGLSEHMKSIPILDGSRVFEDFSSLKMKFDIKDVEGHLAIKGYVDWAAEVLSSSSWHEKQLCSFIQGHGGFAAVHYSIFAEAVNATINVVLNFKRGCDDDIYPKVCGSLAARYNCYDYSSSYNKDYYRMMLFKRSQNDSVQLCAANWTIPLSRSTIVVPSYSSLVINVDLLFGDSHYKLCAQEIEIEIGESCKTLETNDCFLRIELDWCEIK